MQMSWQLQEAKSRFSEVVKRCADAPQIITRHGEPEAVLISKGRYDELLGRQQSLVDFLAASPLADVDLDLQRDPADTVRSIDLGDD